MTRRLSEKRKREICDENEQILKIIHVLGGGVMLRQQAIILVHKITGMSRSRIERSILILQKNGFISTAKLFAGCINKVLVLNNYAIGHITGKSSRDCKASDTSPKNLLYLTFRSEIILWQLSKLNYIQKGPFLTKKNNGLDLYRWFEKQVPTLGGFENDHEIEKGLHTRKKIHGEKDFDIFNFKSLLFNNFLVWGTSGEEKKSIYLIFLDSNRIKPNKFYKCLYCVLFMLAKYTTFNFNEIILIMTFFSQDELAYFKNIWQKKYANKLLEERQLRMDIKLAFQIKFYSLDLDVKYSLCRDL